MKAILAASVILVLGGGAALAQRGGDTIPMRDGSTIVSVGGCLVQYGARNERINNARRCGDDDIRQADRIMSGGGRGGYGGPGYGGSPGYGGGPGSGGGPDYGGGPGGAPMPGGSWAQSCRNADMRGPNMRAECRTVDGRWNATMLDMRNCPTGVADNRNGSLVCR